ncbi:hypothetical protein BDZ89DRAFT_1130289 [Hymenopellis radicata]|nr:hypothetical protein BDZ89DRAFT_1130289 [Hymenopellis radicata]
MPPRKTQKEREMEEIIKVAAAHIQRFTDESDVHKHIYIDTSGEKTVTESVMESDPSAAQSDWDAPEEPWIIFDYEDEEQTRMEDEMRDGSDEQADDVPENSDEKEKKKKGKKKDKTQIRTALENYEDVLAPLHVSMMALEAEPHLNEDCDCGGQVSRGKRTLQHVEGALNYNSIVAAWQRITNNTSPWSISELTKQLRRVFRIWCKMKSQRHSGTQHEMHLEFPHRQKNHLMVLCPACPEYGFNMPKNWTEIPPEYRHLCVIQKMNDGNFKIHCAKKNSDPDDVNLLGDRGLQPNPDTMKEYRARKLKKAKKNEEKVPCNNHRASNDKSKRFADCQYSGIRQGQCCYAFVYSTVDFPRGEDQKSMDMATARNLERSGLGGLKQGDPIPPVDYAYDCMCQYCINLEYRFANNKELVHLLPVVKQMRKMIGATHVYAHVDICKYIYGPFYMQCAGHFHGETSEHFWPTSNPFDPLIFQMNIHYGHEIYFYLAMDWNYRKTMAMPNLLYKDLTYAVSQYRAFDREFAACTAKNEALIPSWKAQFAHLNGASWKWVTDTKGKEVKTDVESPYKHRSKKMPSVDKVIEAYTADPCPVQSVGGAKSNDLAIWIAQGVSLEKEQRDLVMLIAREKKYPSTLDQEMIRRSHKHIEQQMEVWLELQQKYLDPILKEEEDSEEDDQSAESTSLKQGKKANSSEAEEGSVEKWILALPSSLTPMLRERLDYLVQLETEIREGAAFQALQMVTTMADCLRTLASQARVHGEDAVEALQAKIKYDGPVPKSISTARQYEWERNKAIADWNAHREALLTLGTINQTQLHDTWMMTKHDTFLQKGVDESRVPGDSRRHDGDAHYMYQRRGTTNNMAKVKGGGLSERNAERSRREKRISGGEASTSRTTGKSMEKAAKKAKEKESQPGGSKRKCTIGQDEEGGDSSNSNKSTAKKAGDALTNINAGWIYRLQERGNITTEEVEEWRADGERVRWYRLSAERDRWLEATEKGQADSMFTIISFSLERNAWMRRAKVYDAEGPEKAGYTAYVRERSWLYQDFLDRMKDRVYRAGFGHILHLPRDKVLWDVFLYLC